MKKILYFGAEWCGQCKALRPMFEKECTRLGLKEHENWEYYDADKHEDLTSKYGIRNLPTLIFLNGEEVAGRATTVTAWQEIKNYFSE